MININNLSMGFSKRTLFKDVTFSIFPNEKIGLTGPNGSGKTTLFSIILKETEPLAGEIVVQKGINIGYLPQEAHFDSNKTVIEELTEGDDRIRALMEEKRVLEDKGKADSDRYGDLMAQLESLGIYDLEHKAEKILSGLGFKEEDFHKPVLNLSGGWQMRTLLAKLLTYPYDLLLLDEPTNYLDLPATLWLKDFLAQYPGAFILISHDRVLLNEVTNYTVVLDSAQMFKVKGNYETYEEQRGINQKFLERQKKVVDKKREQLERFTQRFHAQPNRAAAVRNKRKQIERLEDIELAQEHRSISEFEFSNIKESGYVVATANQIAKSYGDKKIYEKLDYEIIRNQKICLVGPNGAGKSTLLKMLAGVLKPDAGEVKYGHNVEHGYFSQTRLDVLTPTRSAFDEVMSSAPSGTPAQRVRDLLSLFSFYGDDVFKQVQVLSGGEKSRLILAKLLIDPPNFMLLDEPTTHLDLDGVRALTSAFQNYPGTIVFISHDLYFIKEIADNIVEVNSGEIKTYPGNLDYYLEKKGQKGLHAPQAKDKKSNQGDAENSGQKHKGQSQKNSEAGPLQGLKEKHEQALERIKQIKNEIKKLEVESEDLEKEMYVKARVLERSYEKRDEAIMKEYGARLKAIQARQREIEMTLKKLREERDGITK